MAVKSQISVFLENRPGTLAKACGALARKKVNIQAISVADTVDSCVVRMVVDKTTVARNALRKLGLTTSTAPVVVKRLLDRPGALATEARKLAKKGINISYCYGSVGAGGTPIVVFRVDNPKKANRILG